MSTVADPFGHLSSGQRRALRILLIDALAAYGREPRTAALDQTARRAPTAALPAAAALHRVSGAVEQGLEGVGPIDGDVRRALAAGRSRAALNHLLSMGALSRAAQELDEAGARWVVMKGPVAATLLYDEAGDRSYGDLDLLVDRRDFGLAMRIFERQGYSHSIHNWALATEMLAGEVGLSNRTVHIDLHWHLHYSEADRRASSFPIADMLERARRIDVSGVRTPTFDAVDTLITLAYHAARSDGHRLLWMKDLERSLAVEQPDLDEVVRRCRVYRCGPPVGLMLARSKALLGADVPDDIVEALLPASFRVADRFFTSLVHPIRLDERPTPTRWFVRSVRSSALASVAEVPVRAVRSLRRAVFPPPINETDDEAEKDHFIGAVAASEGP